MALPESGILKMSDIVGEFGGETPHSLGEYRSVDGVPESGALSFSDFYGKSAFTGTHEVVNSTWSDQGDVIYGYMIDINTGKPIQGTLTPKEVTHSGAQFLVFNMAYYPAGVKYIFTLISNNYNDYVVGKSIKLETATGSITSGPIRHNKVALEMDFPQTSDIFKFANNVGKPLPMNITVV